MLEIKPAHLQTWEVEYEPGDCTRYSFYIVSDRYVYHILANNSTFNLPTPIPAYKVTDYTEEELIEEGKIYNCNPCTFKAVIDVLKKIKEGV